MTASIIMFMFVSKHFIADFILQTPWMIREKGNYGEAGGLVHSGIHVLFTVTGLTMLTDTIEIPLGMIILIGAIEFIVHYHVDWAKIKLNRYTNWNPSNPEFWYLLGLDQYLHVITYVAFTWWILS